MTIVGKVIYSRKCALHSWRRSWRRQSLEEDLQDWRKSHKSIKGPSTFSSPRQEELDIASKTYRMHR